MKRIVLPNPIEENYPINVRVSLLITLIFIMALFLLFPHYTPRPYKLKRVIVPMKMENIETQKISKVEEPPPVAKPKIAVAASSDKEVEQQTIGKTTFDVNTPPPPKVKHFFRVYEQAPVLVSKPKAEYPEIAKKMGLEGRVFVQLDVDTTGIVVDAKIIKSSNEIFNQAALSAAKRLRFKPAETRGMKIPVRIVWPIVFTLENQ
jgi:protein TonB